MDVGAGAAALLAASRAIASWPFSASKATLALKAGPCFLRPCDISCFFPTATAALSFEAGLSLRHLSEILAPPQEKSFANLANQLIRSDKLPKSISAAPGVDSEAMSRRSLNANSNLEPLSNPFSYCTF